MSDPASLADDTIVITEYQVFPGGPSPAYAKVRWRGASRPGPNGYVISERVVTVTDTDIIARLPELWGKPIDRKLLGLS